MTNVTLIEVAREKLEPVLETIGFTNQFKYPAGLKVLYASKREHGYLKELPANLYIAESVLIRICGPQDGKQLAQIEHVGTISHKLYFCVYYRATVDEAMMNKKVAAVADRIARFLQNPASLFALENEQL